MNIILASASIRRAELLEKVTNDFKIVVSDFVEENIPFSGNCGDYVMALARGKAMDICSKVKKPSAIIGSDTVVYINGKVLGKPKDREDAFQMLSDLSDNTHEVYTGIAIINTETQEIITEYVCTKVKFSKLSEIGRKVRKIGDQRYKVPRQKQINKYIESGEPFDKAGAYGIQGAAAVFVEEIHGCYYNVVGLPVNKLWFMLREMGVNL